MLELYKHHKEKVEAMVFSNTNATADPPEKQNFRNDILNMAAVEQVLPSN